MGTPQETSPAGETDLRTVFVEISERCTLPPLQQVAARAMNLLQDPDASYGDIAAVIEKDPALAARVLRMASSAFYVRRMPPDCLSDAIRTVGLGGLRDVIVAAALRPAFDPDDGFHKRLWHHLLATGVAAEAVARTMGARRGGPAFVAGLLHDTGRLVHHLTDREAFARHDMAHRDDPCPEERSCFGATHDFVAGCLAWKWGLDPRISEALIQHHGSPAHAEPLTKQVILGDLLARAIEAENDEAPDAALLEENLQAAGLSVEPEQLMDEIRQTVEENRAFFD